MTTCVHSEQSDRRNGGQEPDRIQEQAREIEQVPDSAEPSPAAREKAQEQLVRDAADVFNGEMYKLFGDRMDGVIDELNEVLAA